METILTADTSGDSNSSVAVEVEKTIAHFIEQMQEAREQMKADDADIARVKAENAVLKTESQTLRDETRAILARLQPAS